MMGRHTRPRAGAASRQPPQRERHLQDRLIQTAQYCGWTAVTSAGEQIDLIYHTLDSRGSTIGFPDLFMVRDGALLALECKRGLKEVAAMPKSARGRAQLAWIEAMSRVPGVRAAVVCPENERMALAWITEKRRYTEPPPVVIRHHPVVIQHHSREETEAMLSGRVRDAKGREMT